MHVCDDSTSNAIRVEPWWTQGKMSQTTQVEPAARKGERGVPTAALSHPSQSPIEGDAELEISHHASASPDSLPRVYLSLEVGPEGVS